MKLMQWMVTHDPPLSDRDVARLLGLNRFSVFRYRHGNSAPPWPVMLAIYEITGGAVTPNDFLPEEWRVAASRKPAGHPANAG